MESKTFYRRNLPHYHPEEAIFFVTFNLANSLPRDVVAVLDEERQRELERIEKDTPPTQRKQKQYEAQKRAFGRYDAWLDRCKDGPHWLAEEPIARIVADQIHALDGERYRLLVYCIMSNHVHLLIDASGYLPAYAANHQGKTAVYPLADTIRLLKGRTARFCDQALGRSGAFWHHESYDHVVRDEGELLRIMWYILNNPVKAGLVARWQDWPFTWCHEELVSPEDE
ncbi:MAG: hypothetical protein D6698_15920 [Gammaproteobacteria bacterium]|nr:MAG: hypothetical protein D6698_15920 [Gammaproteobacteria bacterium]